MPKIPLSYQQHRHVIGNHTNWRGRKQGNQKYHDDYIQHLARIPGRHTENICRQDIAYTALQLISMLSVVRNCGVNPPIIAKRTSELSMMNCTVPGKTRYDLQMIGWDRQNLISGRDQTSAEIQKKELLRVALNLNEGQAYADTVNVRLFPDSICNDLKTVQNSVTNMFYKMGQFISHYDPLKFPEVAAFPENNDHYAINKMNEQAIIRNNKVEKPRTIPIQLYPYDERCRYLTKYYANYHAKYPTLKTLAETILKDKILERFNLRINPNKASIMGFSITAFNGDDGIHFPPVWKNKTLTKLLFANIDAELRSIQIASDEMYGIYDISQGPQKEYHISDELKIRPIELLELVRDINFGQYVKEKLAEFFKNKDEHIKKYFIDFVSHIETSHLDNNAVKDVLTGVGILKEKDIRVCVFDIDGDVAVNAFIFRNKNKRVTLYLPRSTFKFISFSDDVVMRSWMKDICATKEYRDMIASHFSIIDRQNDEGYYGLNAWLNFIHEDDMTDVIATKLVDVSPTYFFEYLFNHIRDKTFSDLDYIMKLDDGIREGIYEQTVDTFDAIYNTNISFLSLEKRLKCVIDVVNYYGKESEKCSDLKCNATDMITMVTLSNLLSFHNKEGYDFINMVIKSLETANVKEIEFVPEKKITKKPNLIQSAQKYLTEFYKEYNSKYPELKILANSVLKKRIQECFNLKIDPDNVRFVHFDNTVYEEGGEKVHYPPARENRTLTEWLFTNFDAETQDNLQDMDSMCGIYDNSVWKKEKYHSSDELKLKPTDFIRLVYEIDFYNYAKNKLSEFFEDKDIHIKKYLIDFVNHLDVSNVRNEPAKDLLSGVGIGKGRKIQTSLFDIDGYSASNAFVFRNEEGRVTLYFPGSDFKFKPFRDDVEMRAWVTSACSTKAHRDMIASHFTIANRQDGILFYGIDAWLKFIDQNNAYYDKIARRPKEIEPEHFFDFLFAQIKEKAFSDLDSLIKSDAEIRRDMWENMIDVSNVLPNPVSSFLSLGMHLEHVIEADTYGEKLQEWKKIKSDAVNIVTTVVLLKAMHVQNIGGYKLIDAVNKAIETEDMEEVIQASEMRVRIQDLAQEQDPGLPSLGESLDGQRGSNIIANYRPLKKFLPLREIKLETDVNKINDELNRYTLDKLKNNPYSIFYGFNEEPFDSIPQYVRNGRANLRLNIRVAKERLGKAYRRLYDPTYKLHIREYLSMAFDTRDTSILIEATERLKIQVERAYHFLLESESRGFHNFGIVSTRQVLESIEPLSFRSLIDDRDVLQTMVLGFTFKNDPLRRIFFMNDAMPIIKPNGVNSLGENRMYLDQIVIHEISHASFNSMDFYYNKINLRTGRQLCGAKTLLRLFNRYIEKGTLKESQAFDDFMCDVYKHKHISSDFNKDAALNMLKNDPMLKTNFMMENADNFVAYVKAIGEIRLNQRIKKNNNEISDDSVIPFLALIFTATKNYHIKNQVVV